MIGISLLLVLTGCDRIANPGQTVQGYGRVIDGDSLIVDSKKIRLWGIDAVELNQTCTRNGQPWRCGQAAKTALARKIDGASLTCRRQDRDRYGRIVAECFVSKYSVNGWMVRRGWALAYQRYSAKFIEDERAAKRDRLGLWQSRFEKPWNWRRGTN
ncbi:MAG: thermonuclease family protein [Leptolyngbya sp. SIO4C1]|nr:thermonuclease family protein [Leptolyngbya sp. SIO4C1]